MLNKSLNVLNLSGIGALLPLLVLITLGATAYAETPPNMCKSEEDLKGYLVDLWSNRTNADQVRFLDCLQSSWAYQRSGGELKDAEFEDRASAFMTSALQFNPENFFFEMDERSELLNRWISNNSIESSYTWYKNPPCELRQNLGTINAILKLNSQKLSKYKSFKVVKAKFISIKCIQVN